MSWRFIRFLPLLNHFFVSQAPEPVLKMELSKGATLARSCPNIYTLQTLAYACAKNAECNPISDFSKSTQGSTSAGKRQTH